MSKMLNMLELKFLRNQEIIKKYKGEIGSTKDVSVKELAYEFDLTVANIYGILERGKAKRWWDRRKK